MFSRKTKPSPDLLALLFFLLASSVLWLSSAAAHVRISTKVSWDREIAPIVEARCVSCHRAGGRAPMALTTYEEARPWAKAIKEEVLTRRMPKWHVVRGYGDFANDPSLSAFEIALIASWADGGAPKTLPNSVLPPEGASHSRPAVASALRRKSTTREATVSCTAKRWPAGTLVGVRPALDEGASLRVDLGDEPLLWVKDFDPAFAETYWLRQPRRLATASRVAVMPSAAPSCSVALLYAR